MDVLGLPLHPLVVHAAVVLVPLAALGALVVLAWGELAPYPAVALALLLPAALLLRERSAGLRWTSAALAGLSAVAALVLVVLTGHSGATAVWSGV